MFFPWNALKRKKEATNNPFTATGITLVKDIKLKFTYIHVVS